MSHHRDRRLVYYRGHMYARRYLPHVAAPTVEQTRVVVVQPQAIDYGSTLGIVGAIGLGALVLYLLVRK